MEFRYRTHTRTVLGDLHTPVGAFLRLRDLHPRSALMECSDYNSAADARSFVCLDPIGEVAVGHGVARLRFPDGSHVERAVGAPGPGLAAALEDFEGSFRVEGEMSELAGMYGYTSFNAVRYLEPVAVKDERMAENDAPDVLYILFRTCLVFDHFSNRLTVVELLGEGESPRRCSMPWPCSKTMLASGRRWPIRSFSFLCRLCRFV